LSDNVHSIKNGQLAATVTSLFLSTVLSTLQHEMIASWTSRVHGHNHDACSNKSKDCRLFQTHCHDMNGCIEHFSREFSLPKLADPGAAPHH
jgi:hypothetical protein